MLSFWLYYLISFCAFIYGFLYDGGILFISLVMFVVLTWYAYKRELYMIEKIGVRYRNDISQYVNDNGFDSCS